jgi:hypothetical protein
MVGQQETASSLHQRVSEYLRDEHIGYAREESEEEALADIFSMLLKAREDLRVAQERVNLLKWELAKVKS